MIRRMQHWLTNQRGATALEYAMVMPLLFSVIFVSIEVTFILFADAQLEAAANAMTRYGKIGIKDPATGNLTRPTCDQLMTVLRNSISGWVYNNKAANLWFTTSIYSATGGPATAGCDSRVAGGTGSGAEGDLVLYTINVNRTGFTGFITLLGQGNTWQSQRALLIQNER